MASMAVLKTHHKAIHHHHGREACTECTWTRDDRPSDVLVDHPRSVHDIYRPGHPEAFSTNVRHIGRMTIPMLRRLLAEDRATLAALRGVPPPPPAAEIPNAWKTKRLALEVRSARLLIKQQPGWQAEGGPHRAVGRLTQGRPTQRWLLCRGLQRKDSSTDDCEIGGLHTNYSQKMVSKKDAFM